MVKTHKKNQMRFMKSKRMKNNQKTKRNINNKNNKTKKHDYKNVMLEEVINFRQQYNDISTNMINEIELTSLLVP